MEDIYSFFCSLGPILKQLLDAYTVLKAVHVSDFLFINYKMLLPTCIPWILCTIDFAKNQFQGWGQKLETIFLVLLAHKTKIIKQFL